MFVEVSSVFKSLSCSIICKMTLLFQLWLRRNITGLRFNFSLRSSFRTRCARESLDLNQKRRLSQFIAAALGLEMMRETLVTHMHTFPLTKLTRASERSYCVPNVMLRGSMVDFSICWSDQKPLSLSSNCLNVHSHIDAAGIAQAWRSYLISHQRHIQRFLKRALFKSPWKLSFQLARHTVNEVYGFGSQLNN